MVVEGLLYTKEHLWVKIEDNVATIGITDHAQEQLGEINFVELPEVGKELEANDELGVVESSKAASEIHSPAAGKVTEVNPELDEHPELINQDCYETGWICKLDLAEKVFVENLMSTEQYEQYLKQQ